MYIDLKEKDFTKLEEPAQIIKNGGIVVFPTETVYGIGANALNAEAVKKIYEIKKRPLSKPITLLVNSIDMIKRVAKDITPFEYAIIKKFFPGPLTIILQKKDVIPDIVTSGGSTVGIRMPANEIALELINRAGVPLATPSANISDKPSKTNIKDVMSDFPEGVDCFIDGGKSKIGVASTIVQVIDGVPHILRQGTITEEQINKLII
ncbi:MAG: L-threonylcarbamoyladenylate synthase [Clostridium sp.]|nr:L-threonylcarbamoyladenylate synthase [Clostridium sp.]